MSLITSFLIYSIDDQRYLWVVARYEEERDDLYGEISKLNRALEIAKMEHDARLREAATLDDQLQTQTKFSTLMVENIDTLTQQNKELEDMLVAQRRATKNGTPKGTSNDEIGVLQARNRALLKESQLTNKTILSLSKENSALKRIIATYSVGVLEEHNYA